MMDMVGEENRKWASDLVAGILAKVPHLTTGQIEDLLVGIRDAGTGLRAIGRFLDTRTPAPAPVEVSPGDAIRLAIEAHPEYRRLRLKLMTQRDHLGSPTPTEQEILCYAFKHIAGEVA